MGSRSHRPARGADQLAQATGIDRSDLLYQDPDVFTKQIYLWSKRRRPGERARSVGERCPFLAASRSGSPGPTMS